MEKTVHNEPATAARRTGLKLHHETAHYRVVSGVMTGPEDQPKELLLKYIVQHKTDGVIYGVSGGLGAAIVAAHLAEKELTDAAEMVAAETERQPGNGTPPLFS